MHTQCVSYALHKNNCYKCYRFCLGAAKQNLVEECLLEILQITLHLHYTMEQIKVAAFVQAHKGEENVFFFI